MVKKKSSCICETLNCPPPPQKKKTAVFKYDLSSLYLTLTLANDLNLSATRCVSRYEI